MSNALAIAGVTAVLQYYLTETFGSAEGFPTVVKVSCIAPDLVHRGLDGVTDAVNQVNIFMHQVTHNAAWRNTDLASMSSDGGKRLSNPPLALDLHYLLTAYGSDDGQAEALLGYSLMMLHEAPVLTRADITSALQAVAATAPAFPNNKLLPLMTGTGLADQIEMIKITPETMGREELAWLWTALKADYRPTFPFKVSVVLMTPTLSMNKALPVLRRNFSPVPMRTAQIESVQYAGTQTAALPGDTVTIAGSNLMGAARVSISNQRYGILLQPTLTQALPGSVSFALPTEAMQAYPAGAYEVVVQFLDGAGPVIQQTTNALGLGISPTLPTQNAATAAVGANLVAVTVTGITPALAAGQSVTLSLSTTSPVPPVASKSAAAQPFNDGDTALTFQFDTGLPTGVQLLARLQVDGVTSQITVNLPPPPAMPSFGGPWVTL